MKGRHFFSGLFYMLLGWLFQFSVVREKSLIEVKKKFLWIFTCRHFSFDMNTDDVSVFQTSCGSFKTDHLIINGKPYVVSPSVVNKISELFKNASISLAPLIYSLDSKEPEYVLQVGRETLYYVDDCVDGPSWEYKYVSYNKADLGDGKEYLLVNSVPIAVTDSQKAVSFISILKKKGCTKDPYIISPIAIKQGGGSSKRYSYLLLGSEYCFKELYDIRMEEIVYFDYDKTGCVHFGTGVDFYYPKLQQSEINAIKDYFISKGAELHAAGEKFTTRVTYKFSTWFKKRRQTVTLGSRGAFYTRIKGTMSMTSFIPYHDFYFINPIGWRFWGRRLEIFGSQNIQTPHTFKNKDYKRILEKIYSFNPQLKNATGKAYRAFSWNPFKSKPFVVIGDGMLIHGHPKRKERVALEGTFVKDSKKYGRFYHLFKDVVIDTRPSNIRYDESHKLLQVGQFTEGTKIDSEDEWLQHTEVPLFMTHLWFSTANRLVSDVDYVKGKESRNRIEYRDSDQAKEDLKRKHAVMSEFAQKPSLIKFLIDLRSNTGCDVDSVRMQQNTLMFQYSVPERDRETDFEFDNSSVENISEEHSQEFEYNAKRDKTEVADNAKGFKSEMYNSDDKRVYNQSQRRIIIIVSSFVVLAILLFFGIKTIILKDKSSDSQIENSSNAIEGLNLDDQSDEGIFIDKENNEEEIELIDEGVDVHPDGYDEIIDAEAEESVRKFLMNFFSNILPTNRKNWDTGNLVKQYFTPEFAKAYRMVDQNALDGDIGYFDYDLFTHSQDPDYDKAEISNIIVYSDSGNQVAEVSVSLKSKVYPQEEIEISLIQKNNKWMISDYNGELSGMKNYMEMQ